MKATELVGIEELKEFLTSDGFRFMTKSIKYPEDYCTWYAYRRSELQARACESNDDKPGMQIVVTPSEFDINGRTHKNVEIEVCGEADGVWWKMSAYGLNPSDVPGKISNIEQALISAWNSLKPNDKTQRPAS